MELLIVAGAITAGLMYYQAVKPGPPGQEKEPNAAFQNTDPIDKAKSATKSAVQEFTGLFC